MFSILHISDLHRSRDEPVDNDSLLAALLADQDRYLGETPRVPPPDAIVVSGDIIQGAALDVPNWRQTIKDQYQIAEDFLDRLCRRFIGGDRSRLVLVPGNHDVCWNTSHAAMRIIPPGEYPADIYRALALPNSPYRWSWKERALYQIADFTAYDRRTDFYWDFAEQFYDGVALAYPLNRVERVTNYSSSVAARFSSQPLILLPETIVTVTPVRSPLARSGGVLAGLAAWKKRGQSKFPPLGPANAIKGDGRVYSAPAIF